MDFPKTAAEREIDRLAVAEFAKGASSASLDVIRASLWLDRPDLYEKYQEQRVAPEHLAAVEKVVSSVRDASDIGKSGQEYTLESRAREIAARDNISFAKAYDRVLQTPEGSELYGRHRDAKRG